MDQNQNDFGPQPKQKNKKTKVDQKSKYRFRSIPIIPTLSMSPCYPQTIETIATRCYRTTPYICSGDDVQHLHHVPQSPAKLVHPNRQQIDKKYEV